MNSQDPLAQLRDIHLPATGGLWPPAPGWWVLAIVTLTAVAALAVFLVRRHRRHRWRREARTALERLEQRAEPSPAWFVDLNTLLKQVARHCHPGQHPEALTGDAWARFLLATADDADADETTALELVRACWRPASTLPPWQALAFAHRWLEAQTC